jgi:hypothetical protein
MNSSPRRSAGAALMLGLVALAGCGGGPVLAPVTGKVTLNGKPLERIALEFHPDGEGPRSTGLTGPDGTFTLTTDTGKPGAVVGPHKVVLRDQSIFPDGPISRDDLNKDLSSGKKPRIKAEYGDRAKTTVTKTVENGKTNEITIELK